MKGNIFYLDYLVLGFLGLGEMLDGGLLDCAETSKLAPFACLRIIGSATLQPVPGPWRKIATFPLGVFHCYCGYLNICQCGAAAEMDVGRMPRTRR